MSLGPGDRLIIVKTLFDPKAGAEEVQSVSTISQLIIGAPSGWNGQSNR